MLLFSESSKMNTQLALHRKGSGIYYNLKRKKNDLRSPRARTLHPLKPPEAGWADQGQLSHSLLTTGPAPDAPEDRTESPLLAQGSPALREMMPRGVSHPATHRQGPPAALLQKV